MQAAHSKGFEENIEQNNLLINTASVVPARTGPHIVVENTEI
jgi:hypothetical protein